MKSNFFLKRLTKEMENQNPAKKSHVNLKMLYDKLEEHDIDINTLARMTRISKSSLHRKMRGEQEFSLRDIGRLTYTLDLEPEEVFYIFLAGYLPKKCRKAA